MPENARGAAIAPDLAFLAPICRPARRFRPGQAVFRAGEATAGLFLLEAGRVHLLRPLADGSEALVHRASPGGTFAEAAIFAERYHCDAVAVTQARVRLAPGPAVRAALAADPAFAAAFAARLARQVQDLRGRVEVLSVHGASARVMAFLAQHARDGDGGAQMLELGRPMRQVAAEIGLSHEALYRTLARLVRQGRIARQGRSGFTLLDEPAGPGR